LGEFTFGFRQSKKEGRGSPDLSGFVILWERWRQSVCDKIDSMGMDGIDAFALDVLPVPFRQFEPGPELRFFKGSKCYGDLLGHL
jgi:hypothetical protein